MRQAIALVILAVAFSGCASGALDERGGPGDPMDPADPMAPAAWSIEIDTTATDPFVPHDAPAATITGRVTASAGVRALEVAEAPVPVASGGAFTASVPVTPGLVHVPIEAQDSAMHRRRGDRSLLVADYLPEGDVNQRAASMALTEAFLDTLAAPLQARVASIDIASEILARDTLTDDRCRTVPTGAHHGTPRLDLVIDATGNVVLQIVIPDLQVTFEGSCRLILSSTDVTGSMSTHVVLSTTLFAPLSGECAAGLSHGEAAVELVDFDLSVHGGSGLTGLLVSLGAELQEGDTAAALSSEFSAQAGALLDSELSMVSLFGEPSTRAIFGVEMEMGMCLMGLVAESGMARAIVGTDVRGPGLADAPGAPMIRGDLPPAMPATLTLDAGVVSQMLFSAWRAGALGQRDVMQVPISMLAIVAPRLRTMYPADTMVTVDLDGGLPPMVRALGTEAGGETPASAGDLVIEIGDLDLVLRVGEDVLFRIGNVLRLTLELVPESGALRPMVVSTDATTWVEEEPIVDANDAALEAAIGLQIGDAAGGLLGDAAIELPAIGGVPIAATDVVADPGGRYLHVRLAP